MTDQTLDKTRPLIMARANLVNGHQLDRSEPVAIVDDETDERGKLTTDQATHLLGTGLLVYADRVVATPVETPEQYAARVTEVDDLGKGKFLIRAPWIGEGEEVAADKLEARRQEIVDLGVDAHRELIGSVGPDSAVAVMTHTDGFSAADMGNGNFEITGPGLSEPLKIRGRQNAEDKLAELRLTAAQRSSAASSSDAGAGAGTAEVRPPAGPGAVTDVAPPVVEQPQ